MSRSLSAHPFRSFQPVRLLLVLSPMYPHQTIRRVPANHFHPILCRSKSGSHPLLPEEASARLRISTDCTAPLPDTPGHEMLQSQTLHPPFQKPAAAPAQKQPDPPQPFCEQPMLLV